MIRFQEDGHSTSRGPLQKPTDVYGPWRRCDDPVTAIHLTDMEQTVGISRYQLLFERDWSQCSDVSGDKKQRAAVSLDGRYIAAE